MSNTSAAVKNRWNEKNYDRVYVTIPKGYGEKLKEYCKENGVSVNSVVFDEISRRMEDQNNSVCSPSEE